MISAAFYILKKKKYRPFQGIQVTAAARAAHTFLPVCAVFPCVHTMVWLPVFDFFNVRTHLHTQLYRHCKKVCTKRQWQEKSTPGTQIHVSIAPGLSAGTSTS